MVIIRTKINGLLRFSTNLRGKKAISRLKYIEIKELDLKECDLLKLPLNPYRKLANSPDLATDKEIIEVLALDSLAMGIGTLSDEIVSVREQFKKPSSDD